LYESAVSQLQPVPRYRDVTETALQVLDCVTVSDMFRLLIRHEGHEGQLVIDIAVHVHYRIMYQDVQLHSCSQDCFKFV